LIDEKEGRGLRYTVVPGAQSYVERGRGMFPAVTEEILDPLTLMKESLLMGFRYIEGPDEDLFRRRFRRGPEDLIPRTLADWRKRGLVKREKPALSREGLLFLDPFLIESFEELEGNQPQTIL
jgi:oxygen-independent coproporphyrinogen-3 oxidase